MRDIRNFACRDPVHQAQCRRATFGTCIIRKMDDRLCVAEEVFDLFACNTFCLVGVAYSRTVGPIKRVGQWTSSTPILQACGTQQEATPLLMRVINNTTNQNLNLHFSSTGIWRRGSVQVRRRLNHQTKRDTTSELLNVRTALTVKR
jgi:hypothetical protein